jgi:hypothetical protein
VIEVLKTLQRHEDKDDNDTRIVVARHDVEPVAQ